MSSNILIAIRNLVENSIIALTAHYSGRNRVNGGKCFGSLYKRFIC